LVIDELSVWHLRTASNCSFGSAYVSLALSAAMATSAVSTSSTKTLSSAKASRKTGGSR
jgi:hypothetical protein